MSVSCLMWSDSEPGRLQLDDFPAIDSDGVVDVSQEPAHKLSIFRRFFKYRLAQQWYHLHHRHFLPSRASHHWAGANFATGDALRTGTS